MSILSRVPLVDHPEGLLRLLCSIRNSLTLSDLYPYSLLLGVSSLPSSLVTLLSRSPTPLGPCNSQSLTTPATSPVYDLSLVHPPPTPLPAPESENPLDSRPSPDQSTSNHRRVLSELHLTPRPTCWWVPSVLSPGPPSESAQRLWTHQQGLVEPFFLHCLGEPLSVPREGKGDRDGSTSLSTTYLLTWSPKGPCDNPPYYQVIGKRGERELHM